MPVWTIYVAHQANARANIWGTPRKWKKFEINEKVRQDSPPEYTTTIEYDSSITFNDIIQFQRDGVTEWVGFVEDIEIDWDENSRYLLLGGRDLTYLLWRKYVENFNNAIKDTGGFFGNVNAVELTKFLLRTPRSDLPEVEDDSLGSFSIYPYNKEGWGIDISNFTGLTTGGHVKTSPTDNGYGDIATSLLRKRDMVWGNSGSPNQASNQTTDGQVNGVTSITEWTTYGSSPFINSVNQGKTPTNYIKSSINTNATAIFTQNSLNLSYNATGVNSCYLTIIGASDGSWGWWDASNCYIYVWVESYQSWLLVGNFGGRSAASAIGNVSNLNWRTLVFNLSSIIMTVNDLNLAQIKFVEYGSLSTFIQYAYLSIGFVGSGNITAGEWVNIQFNPAPIMGVYIESRASIDQFPQNYHITTLGPLETFNGYQKVDSDSYIVENAGEDTIAFTSWQSNNPSKIAYFYRQGINANETGPIGDFSETFAFNISSSQPCTVPIPSGNNTPPAFVPWCLANQLADYSVIRNGTGNFTALEILNIGGVLSIQTIQKTGGSSVVNNATVIELDTPYYVQVSRSGSALTYNVFTQATLVASSQIYTYTFTTSATYTYRYQAITYNQIPLYGTLYSDSMDNWDLGGERFINGGFETGDGTGWTLSNATVISDSGAYSGSYDLYLPCTQSLPNPPEQCTATQTNNFKPVYYADCIALGFYHKGQVNGKRFQYFLYYSDGSTSPINVISTQTTWVYEDALANSWTNHAKQVVNIFIDTQTFDDYILWVDAFSCKVSTINGWDAYGGTAQESTNNTKQIEGTGCQEIHCTSNGQDWYFEKNLPTPINTIRVDSWVRLPPPVNDNTNTDVLVNQTSGWNTSGTTHWSVYGAYPYVRSNSDEDDNHIYITGNLLPSFASDDYTTFDSIDTSLSKNFFAVSATTNCRLNVSSRIVQNVGGTGKIENCQIRAYLWVQHMNNGAGGWVQIGDSGLYVFVPTLLNPNASAWTNTFATIDPSSYLSSMYDWLNAKIRFSFYGSAQTSGDPSKAQFQIGQVKLHWDGTGSDGYVSILKVHNSSAGVDPATNYIAQVVVAPSEWATSNQDYMRFMVRGLNGLPVAQNGEWGTGWTEFPIPYGNLSSPNPWVRIGLYVNVDSVNGYIKLYNITGWDQSSVDANGFPTTGAYLLCELTGLSNTGNGLIDRVDYEAEYESGYGSGSTYDTYLDLISIYTFNVETSTVGTIFAGQGPEINLLPDPVTGNFYPDIIHSWETQTISNIKIYCDDNETAHGWEITQIYVYKTDIEKFCVTMSDPPVGFAPTPFPNEIKLIFNEGTTPIVSPYVNIIYDGTTVTIKDQNGNIIISGTPSSPLISGFFSIWAENTASFSSGSETITCNTPFISNTQTFAELNASSGGAGEIAVYSEFLDTSVPFNYVLDATNLTFTEGSYLYFAIDDQLSDTYYGLTSEIYGYIYWDGTNFYVWVFGANNLNVARTIFLDTSSYVDAEDTDVGLGVYRNAYDGPFGPNYIGTLLDYDNDGYEWRVDTNGGNTIPIIGDTILLATSDGGFGSGQGILSSEAVSVWAGGPYIYLNDVNIDYSIFSTSELFWIGPANIPKNRLSDVLWDIATLVNDDYVPFEWWISYPSTDPRGICIGDFHIGPRRGVDNSATVSFVTGTNMESVKYQRSSRDTYQRCQVIGSGEGKNQDDTSSFWQNDQDAMDEVNGFAEDIVTQKQVSGGRIANRYAKVQLKLDASPKMKNAITCDLGRDTYPSGTYGCGDDVSLNDFLSGLGPNDEEGGVYRIWNLKITGDENGEQTELTCQAPYLDIANVWKNVYKQLKSIGATGVMAQDWTGDGTQTDKVSAEKLSDLFSVSAKNDTIDVGVGNTDPKWYQPSAFGTGTGWNSASGNLSIWGPSSGGNGFKWVEARYNSTTDVSGHLLTSDTVDIQMIQEPKFTCTFKISEPVSPLTPATWNYLDFVDFGLFDHDYWAEAQDISNPNEQSEQYGAGFLIRVQNEGVGIFNAYAIFCYEEGDYELTIAQLMAQGKAKFICGLISNTKYKASIEVESNSGNYGNSLPQVVVSIANSEITNPPTSYVVWTQFNTVAMLPTTTSFFNTFWVRPIYIFCFGTSGSGHRCQMFFYQIKAQLDVITETNNPTET